MTHQSPQNSREKVNRKKVEGEGEGRGKEEAFLHFSLLLFLLYCGGDNHTQWRDNQSVLTEIWYPSNGL